MNLTNVKAVNGAFLQYLSAQIWVIPLLTHTHSNTQSNIHTLTHSECIRSNWGFSILPADALACRLEQRGIKPPTSQLAEDQL